jgi:hypothetical protein
VHKRHERLQQWAEHLLVLTGTNAAHISRPFARRHSGPDGCWSQGCSIGCTRCDGIGARIPNYDHCPNVSKAGLNLLLPKYRTANRNSTPGSESDIFKFNPWRAPGQAPVFDPW